MELERIREIHADIKRLVKEAADIVQGATKNPDLSFTDISNLLDALRLMERTNYTENLTARAFRI